MTTRQYSFVSSTGPVTDTHSTRTSAERPTPRANPVLPPTNEPRRAESSRHDIKPSTKAPGTRCELSDLRRLLHVASELKQIDLNTALNVYKELMKQTRQEDLVNLEENILETGREQLEQRKSGTNTNRVEKYEELIEALTQANEILQVEKKTLEDKYRQNKIMFKELEMENKKQKADMKSKEDELRKLKKEKDDALTEKNETLTRLSKEMGTKLSDNNPAIADLSDPNRAMKLGEKYNELYDNEWTDALEKLCDGGDDEEAGIKVLLEVLKRCHQICVALSEKQMISLQMALVNPALPGVTKQAWGDVINPMIAKSTYKQLKDCRKEVSAKAVENILKEYATKHIAYRAERIPDFVKKCIEICWLMSVQDPPVVIGGEATVAETFDTNMYKPYTNTGTVVSYNVWPPLLLHENGTLLRKGIVQPVKVEKQRLNVAERKAPAVGMQRHEWSKTYDATAAKTLRSDHEALSYEVPKKEDRSPPRDERWKKQFLLDSPAPVHGEILAGSQHYGSTQSYDYQGGVDWKESQPLVRKYNQQATSALDSIWTSPRNYVQQSVLPRSQPRYPVKSVYGKECVWYKGTFYELSQFKMHFNIQGNDCFYYA